jgi:hypothetical protein
MISTVTTSTVTLAGSFAVFGVIVLLGLLVYKELASPPDQRLKKVLNIGIIPLFIAFCLVVISKVVEALP